MSGIPRTLRDAGIALGVAASLAFGAAQALQASPAARAACGDRYAQGTCTTDAGCNKYCVNTLGAAGGSCAESTGCCYCYEVIGPPPPTT